MKPYVIFITEGQFAGAQVCVHPDAMFWIATTRTLEAYNQRYGDSIPVDGVTFDRMRIALNFDTVSSPQPPA